MFLEWNVFCYFEVTYISVAAGWPGIPPPATRSRNSLCMSSIACFSAVVKGVQLPPLQSDDNEYTVEIVNNDVSVGMET